MGYKTFFRRKIPRGIKHLCHKPKTKIFIQKQFYHYFLTNLRIYYNRFCNENLQVNWSK